MYLWVYLSLNHSAASRDWHSIVNQLYYNLKEATYSRVKLKLLRMTCTCPLHKFSSVCFSLISCYCKKFFSVLQSAVLNNTFIRVYIMTSNYHFLIKTWILNAQW